MTSSSFLPCLDPVFLQMSAEEAGKFQKVKSGFRNIGIHVVLGVGKAFKDDQISVNTGFSQLQMHPYRIAEKAETDSWTGSETNLLCRLSSLYKKRSHFEIDTELSNFCMILPYALSNGVGPDASKIEDGDT